MDRNHNNTSTKSPVRYSVRRERDHVRSRRSRSRSRNRSRRRSRSRSRDRSTRRSPDLYRDLINQDHQEERERTYYRNDNRRSRDRDRERGRCDRRDYDSRYKKGGDKDYSPNSYLEEISNESHESDSGDNNYYTQTPNNKIIVRGLAQHITEADISSDLIQYGLKPLSIRLIRKKKTGASRGFAFVEFSTEEEATRWMEYKQCILMLQDQYRAVMQYSISKDVPGSSKEKFATDWYCGKCGVFNFKRRENCFKCYASREESEKGGEGSDEVSNILTKKIMLRGLDVLTNEEGVLTTMQEVVPSLVSKISKILICRDPLTSTSRGICYLSFDNLVESMNTHNALKALEPPLQIDSREVLISYCVDSENRNILKTLPNHKNNTPLLLQEAQSSAYTTPTYQYTIADVPRLSEYSATMYASNPTEHDHYLKYYTQYYMTQISKGQFNNLPSLTQLSGGDTANSGAAVAASAIQRKMQKFAALQTTATPAATPQVQTPKGNDGKKYPTPDVSLYQYDETSGYYYDPITGLYYDAHSQYYFNNETNSYLYWDSEKSTYTTYVPPAAGSTQNSSSSVNSSTSSSITAAPTTSSNSELISDNTKIMYDDKRDFDVDDKRGGDPLYKRDTKHDKVKVAKKIVKDMEKWAKQLNQKKEMMQMPMMTTTTTTTTISKVEDVPKIMRSDNNNGYADVGFSILEKKEAGIGKFAMELPSTQTNIKFPNNKLVPSYGSDSENEQDEQKTQQHHQQQQQHQQQSHHHQQQQQSSMQNNIGANDYVDFEQLTCLLCKRVFQANDILIKHLKMSKLHKENLQKYNLTKDDDDSGSALSYRDRAKERRQKYGEDDDPPPNKSKERFQRELEKQQAQSVKQHNNNVAAEKIGENNVGNRILQKMGWTQGQGLGRSNQGRTNIIEAESRAANAGLGSKTTSFAPGDDYKSYIKRMMKSRYDSVDVKQ